MPESRAQATSLESQAGSGPGPREASCGKTSELERKKQALDRSHGQGSGRGDPTWDRQREHRSHPVLSLSGPGGTQERPPTEPPWENVGCPPVGTWAQLRASPSVREQGPLGPQPWAVGSNKLIRRQGLRPHLLSAL